MTTEVVHCGPLPPVPGATRTLNPVPPHRDIVLDLSGIELGQAGDLVPFVRDLLVVGAYVLLADGAVGRGRKDDPLAARWRRTMVLHVPVSDPDRWHSARAELVQLLQFITDDSWTFEFREGREDRQLSLNLSPAQGLQPTCVSLFSGGLDSLAGALRLVDAGERPILASHWTTERGRAQREGVLQELRAAKTSWRFPNPALHTVRARNAGDAEEYTQRARGFLYLNLGVAVAVQAGVGRVAVPENAVTSLNLAQSAQSVGAMRSRTTHPKTVVLYRDLLARLGIPVSLEVPFLNSTKAEVIREALERGGEDLTHRTVSCARGLFTTRVQPHCGTCTQCVDRRFAGLSAGWDDDREVAQHAIDLFRDPLPEGEPVIYAEQYLRFASDVLDMTVDEFMTREDVWRAVEDADDVSAELGRLFDVIHRHAEQVERAFGQVWARYQRNFVAGRLPQSGLLNRIGRLEHRRENWLRLADRLTDVVTPGLRKQFAGAPPAGERELQTAIDALQTAARLNLSREFPTVSYALIGTRPDFSAWTSSSESEPDLFIEVKLIRMRADLRSVTDEILADIPKYTSRARKALFLVYDAAGTVPDDETFAGPLEALGPVRVRVMRR